MNDPVTMRRPLVAELRRLRAERNLTQRYVADELPWSPSKIIRIEKDSMAIDPTHRQAQATHSRRSGTEDSDMIAVEAIDGTSYVRTPERPNR